MLDQKDLQAMAELMDARIGKTEEKMIKEVNNRITEVESNLTNRIDEVESKLTSRIDAVEQKVSELEDFLVKQLVRTEDILTCKIEKLANKLAEIDQYYRVEKLENGNMGMVLQILEAYHVRLKNLEMKIA